MPFISIAEHWEYFLLCFLFDGQKWSWPKSHAEWRYGIFEAEDLFFGIESAV